MKGNEILSLNVLRDLDGIKRRMWREPEKKTLRKLGKLVSHFLSFGIQTKLFNLIWSIGQATFPDITPVCESQTQMIAQMFAPDVFSIQFLPSSVSVSTNLQDPLHRSYFFPTSYYDPFLLPHVFLNLLDSTFLKVPYNSHVSLNKRSWGISMLSHILIRWFLILS